MPQRVDQLLTSFGYCSRREARAWVKAGRVTVGDCLVRSTSEKVEAAEVLVDGNPVDHPNGFLLLMHKPLGVVCSHDAREGPTIYDLLPPIWMRRSPQPASIGRLDKETSGLIFITDRTELIHRWTSPRHKVAKVYQVAVDRDLDTSLVELYASGTLQLDGEKLPCRPADLRMTGVRTAELILTEGKYHQVRRMFAACGYVVTGLHRASFGPFGLGDLRPGQFRVLHESEYAQV